LVALPEQKKKEKAQKKKKYSVGKFLYHLRGRGRDVGGKKKDLFRRCV